MTDIRLLDRDFNEVAIPHIRWLEVIPDPLSVTRDTEKMGDIDIVISQQRRSRTLRAKIKVSYGKRMYKKIIKSELFDVFDPAKKYYLIDIGAGGKVWDIQIDEINIRKLNSFTDEWILTLYSKKPYAFSLGTTLDEFSYDSEKWSYGMGLVYDEGTQDYVHNTNSFSIFNAGNQTIDPRQFDLKIRIKSLGGTASTITLSNLTSGDTWIYTGSLADSQEILLDGVKMTKNSANIVGDTNQSVISLKPGFNHFSLSGISGGFEISFEFRYLYA